MFTYIIIQGVFFSDVRERFHIMALLFVVILRNMVAVNWSAEHFVEMLPDVVSFIAFLSI